MISVVICVTKLAQQVVVIFAWDLEASLRPLVTHHESSQILRLLSSALVFTQVKFILRWWCYSCHLLANGNLFTINLLL